MGKTWRLTAAFGGAFVVLAAVYFLSNPPATTPVEKMEPRVLDLTADRVTKIEVDRKGSVLAFERATDSVGEHWRIAGANSHPADSAMVQEMLFGLDRFLKAGAIDPGKPESAPGITGLGDPRLSVTFVSAGRRDVLRFGKQPPTNTTAVFYQHEGDPKIYLVSVDTYEAFNKPMFQYRAKTLARYATHRIHRVVLEFKFLRPQGKGKPDVAQYERSEMDKFEEGMERGWYLTKPHRERLDDHAVAALVTELANLQAGEYQPPGDEKEQGFDEPQARVFLYASGEDKPIEVDFGSPAERGKKRWVRLAGAGEVALYESFRYDEVPLQRNQLRNRVIFPFTSELVKSLEIEAKDMGHVVLVRREEKKPGESVAMVKWEVTEPPNLRVESERLEAFVQAVVPQQVTQFLGVQDFKQAGLDPAAVKLTVETKEGKRHVCWLSPAGYMRKEGVDEVFEVRADFVKVLERLELNFINPEIFNIPRDSLLGFSFESRVSEQLQPVYYKMAGGPNKPWVFTDSGHQGVEADPNRVGDLLAIMNYIKAESLIARDDKTIGQYQLNEETAPATLKIVHEDGPNAPPKTAVLLISRDLSNKPTQPMYYARMSDNKTVFQINGLFVSSLLQAPVKKEK